MKRNKTVILTAIIAILLIVTMGVTFAIFSYTKAGGTQQLVLGDIYMHYNEANAINLAGAMPGDAYNPNNTNSYFEFSITGKNTYTEKDIWYDVSITRGEVPDGKTEANRIPDKYLKFRLVEVNNGVETELFTDETYDDLTNQRVYVAKIEKNTTTEISKTYRLYMVVSEKLTIGNQGEFTTEAWEEAFASVKVNVTGDFNEKVIAKNFVSTVKGTLGEAKGVIAVNTDGTLYDTSDTTQTIREYRYSGADVNNYVTYNNETWRIIGIFSETLEDGTEEEYVKIVRDDILPEGSIPTTYYVASQDNTYTVGSSKTTANGAFWNKPATLKSTNYNDWTTAGLQYYLNTEQDDTTDTPNAGYLSTLSAGAKELIRESTYYLGNYKYKTDTAITGYASERSSNVWSGNQTTWRGLVGLMYPSDYGYSADSAYWTSDPWYWYNAESDGSYARSTSWLYAVANHTTEEWLLSPSSSSTSRAKTWDTTGSVSWENVNSPNLAFGVRPVINLKSKAKIIPGDGSKTNPYVILEN